MHLTDCGLFSSRNEQCPLIMRTSPAMSVFRGRASSYLPLAGLARTLVSTVLLSHVLCYGSVNRGPPVDRAFPLFCFIFELTRPTPLVCARRSLSLLSAPAAVVSLSLSQFLLCRCFAYRAAQEDARDAAREKETMEEEKAAQDYAVA